MTRRLPRWLSGLIIFAAVLGALYLLGNAQHPDTGPDEFPGADLTEKHIDAPNFSGTTIDGQPFDLKKLRGKVVLLNFWATWCGPCKMEIPDLISLQSQYRDKGFTIIGVASGDVESHVIEYALGEKINYPLLMGTQEVAEEYGAGSLPTSVLVGKDGKLAAVMQGVDPDVPVTKMWAKQIDKALAQ